MIDHWFGRLITALDDQALWDSTAVIVCTDHGHYLGEKDIWGKPGVMQYETLGHMPLLVHWPDDRGGTTCDALTTGVDLFATIADIFGVDARAPHARPVARAVAHRRQRRRFASGRSAGVYGNWVQITDGQRKYARAPVGDNFPLSMWSNRWSTMPVHGLPNLLAPPDKRARLDFMPGTDVPVIRQPFEPGDALPYWAGTSCVDQHHCFDVDNDPDENEDLVGSSRGARDARAPPRRAARRRRARRAARAPRDQLTPRRVMVPGCLTSVHCSTSTSRSSSRARTSTRR